MAECEVIQQIKKELGPKFRFPRSQEPQRVGYDVFHVSDTGKASEFVLTLSPNKKYCRILKAIIDESGRMSLHSVGRFPVGTVAAVVKMEV